MEEETTSFPPQKTMAPDENKIVQNPISTQFSNKLTQEISRKLSTCVCGFDGQTSECGLNQQKTRRHRNFDLQTSAKQNPVLHWQARQREREREREKIGF